VKPGRLLLAAVLPGFIVACATGAPPAGLSGAAVPPEPTALPAAAAPAPPEPACEAFTRPGVLRRSALNRAVDGGLGRWLQQVDVDPDVSQGHFRGWIIRRLPDDPCYRQVDLHPGDRVFKVNGKEVERPEQASVVFASLRTARTLVVDFLRGNAPRQLKLDIAEE
jgi:hypothetical protein